MTPTVIQGQALGSIITVPDSTALANLSTQGIAIGTQVYNAGAGAYFALTVSNASLSPDDVVAVSGITGLRWIRVVSSGGSGSVPVVVYVKPTGSDSNDGLTWATAFRTISKGITYLDGLHGGTVNIAPDSIPIDNLRGAGLWIRGPNDEGAGGPGWITISGGNPLNLYFVGNQTATNGIGPVARIVPGTLNGSGSPSDPFIDAVFQYTGALMGITIENFLCDPVYAPSAPACRIGLSSPLDLATWGYDPSHTYPLNVYVIYSGTTYLSLANGNTGNTPSSSPGFWLPIRTDGLLPALTAQVRTYNCMFQTSGDLTFPAVDMGYLFWYWSDQCIYSRFGVHTTGRDDLNCSIRQLVRGGAGVADYLQTYTNCRLLGGGIYAEGNSQLTMATIDAENMATPLWHGVVGSTGNPSGWFSYVSSSDSAYTNTALQNDGDGIIYFTDVSGEILGQAIQIAGDVPHGQTVGKTGNFGSLSWLQHDTGRSNGGLTTGLYPNKAIPLESAQSGWVTGPFGEPASAHLACVNAGYFLGGEITYGAPAIGDYLAWGIWVKFTGTDPESGGIVVNNNGTADAELFFGWPNSGGGNVDSGNGVGNIIIKPGQYKSWFPTVSSYDQGEWCWMGGFVRVVSHAVGASINIGVGPSVATHISRPWLIHVPASDGLTDKQVYRMMVHASSTPAAYNGDALISVPPTPGYPALYPGLKLSLWDATLHAWKYLDVDNGAIRIT